MGASSIHSLLGVRTDFSLGESIIGVDDLAGIAEKCGATHVGVCDTMSVSSIIEASKSLTKAGLTLVSGVRIRVVMEATKEAQASYLKLWPTNEAGMQSIYRLLSRGFEEDRFYYVARVTWDDIETIIDSDNVALSTGDIDSVLQREDMTAALTDLLQRKSFAAAFYELVPSVTPYWSRHNHRAMTFAEQSKATLPDLKPVMIKPAFWHETGGASAFSVNAGIAEKRYYADYLRPALEYAPLPVTELAREAVAAAHAVTKRYDDIDPAPHIRSAIANTAALADVAAYKWSKQEPSLPNIADDPNAALVAACKKGWGERFTTTVFAHKPTAEDLKAKYLPRLQFELDTLKRLGFAQYFLLVSDLVRWSKEQGIFVGPGRGSVGGSLVAYLMGITDVDPMRFELLFERFINPDRLDLPDADLDFMSTRREEVIVYLARRWGAEKVAGIVNYNTMGARSSIRDAARVLDLPTSELGATKAIGDTHGISENLTQAFEASHEIQEFAKRWPAVWEAATALEGKMRSFGTHAGGVVVAGVPLTDRAVVERRGGNSVINWDKRVSEEQGLIKLDVLGLTTLDLFDYALKLIFKRHSIKVNINDLPLDDAKTLAIFDKARTAGVFQFEGGSVRRLLKEMAETRPLDFDDLVALNALNRPGPLDAGLTESYIKRRAGREAVTYPHPVLQPVLEDTFGVICYQEQVMQVARVLSGYTPGEADMLRKIMGKKLPEEMAKQRDKFVQGAVAISGMEEAAAERLFEEIEAFAGYAFNKSHAVEYTLIAYQAAYLKAHYTVEFYCASMSIAGDDNLAKLAKQAGEDGIRVIPPDINISTNVFEPLNDVIVAAPLSVVKGVSSKAAQAIVDMRNSPEPVVIETTSGRGRAKQTVTETYGPGPFVSMEDFRARMPGRSVNSAGMESLNKVGAFARIEPGQAKSTCTSRQRDQIELMPALADQGVAADRSIAIDDITAMSVIDLEEIMRGELGPVAVPAHLGANPRMMVVLDAPFNDHEELTRQYSYSSFVAPSLHGAGLSVNDAVWSWVLRRPLRKGEKDTSMVEVSQHARYLRKEIEITKPPVILLLGPLSVKTFFPDMKQVNEKIGQMHYSAELDATFIIGFKPTQIYFDADKTETLTGLFAEAAKLLEEKC